MDIIFGLTILILYFAIGTFFFYNVIICFYKNNIVYTINFLFLFLAFFFLIFVLCNYLNHFFEYGLIGLFSSLFFFAIRTRKDLQWSKNGFLSVFLDGFDTMLKLCKLKKGEQVYLSESEIVNVIVNTYQAKKNLSSNSYNKIIQLYKKYNYSTAVYKFNSFDEFVEYAIDIIMTFDEIAPYKLYCGYSLDKMK